jgi:membrane-associated phospholipid phosphatase
MLTESRSVRSHRSPSRSARVSDGARVAGLRLWGGVLLAVFVVLTVVTMAKAFKSEDQSIDDSLNRFALKNSGVTNLAKVFADLGQPTIALGVGLLAAVAFYLLKSKNSAYFAAASVIGAYGIATVAKKAVNRNRPVWDASHTLVKETGQSFPSGHAVGTTALVTVLILAAVPLLASGTLRTVSSVVLVLFAVGMVVSRPILGVHFPTDVLAGAFLGVGWTLVCASVLRPWRDQASAS